MPTRTDAPSPARCRALLREVAVSVSQLEQIGVSRATTARRCRADGPWQQPAPGIVLLHNAPLRRDDQRAVALVRAGPEAMITSLDALVLSGMRNVPEPTGPVHVLVPEDRQRTSHGLVLIERTTRLPSPRQVRWPIAPPARAVLDFARRCRDRNVIRAAVAEVVQRGRATPAELVTELAMGTSRGSALVRSVLGEVSAGVRSAAEGEARRLLSRSPVLRSALWNPRLYDGDGRFVAVADAWLDDVAMAWEIDSYEWHLSPADYEHTLERRSTMTAAGIVVVHTSPRRIRTNPRAVLDELLGTHAQAARRPRPDICAVPTTTGSTGPSAQATGNPPRHRPQAARRLDEPR